MSHREQFFLTREYTLHVKEAHADQVPDCPGDDAAGALLFFLLATAVLNYSRLENCSAGQEELVRASVRQFIRNYPPGHS